MESTRQAKIARLLQKELSEMFRRQTAAMGGVLVSVSAVRISPDLSVARGYLSIFPSERAEEILKNINSNARTIRYELGKIVRFQLRKIPELSFFIDDSLDYIEHIDNILKQDTALHRKSPDGEEQQDNSEE
ncbi:MAG TPA: 30S ribosome-binding factor RbfA [Candidatus Limisoma gallistercoris]|nr:30S ribosome-binding factor RbfA [Candidatus Limisoma gallistercoris]